MAPEMSQGGYQAYLNAISQFSPDGAQRHRNLVAELVAIGERCVSQHPNNKINRMLCVISANKALRGRFKSSGFMKSSGFLAAQ